MSHLRKPYKTYTKELKLDFGGDTLPCSDFKANALYFLISALSYNLFALMRQLFVKLKQNHRTLLERVLIALKEFEPPPI